jgi:hypothetical protein
MVEEFIREHNAEYKVCQIWERLPKKVMYQTYKVILAYLLSINKIAIDSENKVGYIWSPEAGKYFKEREEKLGWE